MKTVQPTSFAAEYKPHRSGVWLLHAIRPAEAAAWDDLLTVYAGTDTDLRVRSLRRGKPAGGASPGASHSPTPAAECLNS
jgi:hypothetical protein